MSTSAGPVVAVGFALLALLGLDLALSVALVAVASLSRVSLHRMAGDANGSHQYLESLKTPGSSYRISTHVGRQICLLGVFLVVGMFGANTDWAYPWVIGFAFATVGAVLVIESTVARSLALRNPKAALRRVSPFVRAVHALIYPLVAVSEIVVARSTASVNRSEENREGDQEEEVEAYFQVGEREGILEADEGKMMRSIVDLGDTLVREIMTPRPDIQALVLDTSVEQARRAMLESTRSRMPVYRENIDNIVGILHLRDLVRAWDEGKNESPISAYVRQAFYVPETQTVDDLLEQLRTRTNVALVVDEYGGIAGLVTMEDIMEEIVGDIRDEHDSEEELVEAQADGSWMMSGLVHVSMLEEMYGIEIDDRDFDTVGGLVVSRLGRVPKEDETLEYDGLRITVIKADARRVYKVRIEDHEGRAGDAEHGRVS